MRYIVLFLVALFSGCNHHIEIEKFRPIALKTSPNAPTLKELNRPSMKIVILNIDNHLNQFAKNSNIGSVIASDIGTKLVEKKVIRVIKRLEKPTFYNEQRLFELVDKHGVRAENADYLLTGKITQAKHHYTKQKGRELRGGGRTTSSIYYSACISGTINLFKLPSMQIEDVFPFNECTYTGESLAYPNRDMDYSSLLLKTSPTIAKSIVPKITKRFKPKGYIESMRTDGTKKIIKTTLNRRLGAVEGKRVKIIKIEKEKNLRGGEDTIEIPIGSGTISDMITDSYSFVIIDEIKDEVHRGDVVKVVN